MQPATARNWATFSFWPLFSRLYSGKEKWSTISLGRSCAGTQPGGHNASSRPGVLDYTVIQVLQQGEGISPLAPPQGAHNRRPVSEGQKLRQTNVATIRRIQGIQNPTKDLFFPAAMGRKSIARTDMTLSG